jgi:hypothetical protein
MQSLAGFIVSTGAQVVGQSADIHCPGTGGANPLDRQGVVFERFAQYASTKSAMSPAALQG